MRMKIVRILRAPTPWIAAFFEVRFPIDIAGLRTHVR